MESPPSTPSTPRLHRRSTSSVLILRTPRAISLANQRHRRRGKRQRQRQQLGEYDEEDRPRRKPKAKNNNKNKNNNKAIVNAGGCPLRMLWLGKEPSGCWMKQTNLATWIAVVAAFVLCVCFVLVPALLVWHLAVALGRIADFACGVCKLLRPK